MPDRATAERGGAILVVKPSSLGDILHTFPAVELLRRHFPEARLDWLVHPAFAEVLRYSPFPVDRAIPFRRRQLGRVATMPGEMVRLIGALRRRRYELVVDFQGLFRSALFGFLARGPRPVGFGQPREATARWFYGRRLPVDMQRHAVERNVALVNALLGTDDPVPELKLPEGLFPLDLPAETAGRRLIGVIPGARWETKRFPEALFADIIGRVRRAVPDTAFLVIGGAADRSAGERIAAAAGGGVWSLAGRTGIGQMMEAIRRCELVLSNDSGPIHAAAAFGVPVFGLFGPTRPEWTGPYGAGHHICQAAGVDCLRCMRRNCPGGEPRCHRLDAAAIAAEMIGILATGGTR